jgi:3-oxoacyl-[acyl-carrier-protein] synthase II
VSSNDRVSVVVTGLGATTPLGGDVASTWSAMLAGTSGVAPITEDWAAPLPVRIAAPAAADPVSVVGRVQARKMDRCEQFALVAAREAWADAGSPAVDPYRLGVVVTSGIGGIGSTLAAYDTLRDRGWERISPFTVPMLMPNGAAGWISIEFGARAGAHALVSACASGAESIGYGIDMIHSGRADVVLAGGAEAAIMALNIGAFARMGAMSTRNDEPSRASRPFDKGRDGFVLGEGAGVIVLESLPHALARGARIYAVAAGAGYSADAYHISHGAPDGAGVAFAMTSALRDAGVSASQVAHINAHATSTQEGDPLEARAIETALGPAAARCVVSATKSMTGHLLGGAGAIESVAAILALRDRMAPPTINLEDVDNEVAIDIATAPRPLWAPDGADGFADGFADEGTDGAAGRGGADGADGADGARRPMAVLNNAFGFGGHNVTLAFTEFIPQEA